MARPAHRLPHRRRRPLERVPAHLGGPGGGEPALFRHLLAQEWLPAIPDVDARLRAGEARVADVACGGGWSTLAIARAYPGAEVHGLDLDAEAIGRARAKARDEGLEDRARFHVVDASDHSLDGTFDL